MIWRGTDTKCMGAWEAIQLLDGELGSGQDPIRYQGKETTPIDLGYRISSTPAQLVRITYHGDADGKLKLIRGGTLKRMVEDRIELYKSNRSQMFKPEQTIHNIRATVEKRYWPLLQKIRTGDRATLAKIDAAIRELNT